MKHIKIIYIGTPKILRIVLNNAVWNPSKLTFRFYLATWNAYFLFKKYFTYVKLEYFVSSFIK